MTTFSELVDKIVLEVRRPDLRTDIATYLNQTIREMHFDPRNNAAAEFLDNLHEVKVVANVESGFTWEIPNPALFQKMAAVRFDDIFTANPETQYVRERTPGRGLAGQTEFWYRAGTYLAFAGYGGVNSSISLAYFEYPRALKYYTAENRPATWDADFGWTYSPVFDVTDELRASARFYSTNWMLERWATIIEEGLRAKTYKRTADTERARTSFSSYTALRQGVYTSESSVRG